MESGVPATVIFWLAYCLITYMKKVLAKKTIGVWLDNTKAVIIFKKDGETDSEFVVQDTIKSTSSQSTGNEHTMNNAKKTEQAKYFKSLSTVLAAYDEILLFGPGQVQEQLLHHLKEDQQFNSKKISVETAENASDGQMIATVRKFFN